MGEWSLCVAEDRVVRARGPGCMHFVRTSRNLQLDKMRVGPTALPMRLTLLASAAASTLALHDGSEAFYRAALAPPAVPDNSTAVKVELTSYAQSTGARHHE